MTEELDKKIREIANKYVSECWGSYLDLSETDLVCAGIGVAFEATKELQEENKNIQQSCENYYNEMRSYKNKVEDLEKQIEKMKCCSMCKHYSMSFLPYYCTKNNTAPHCASKCDKWEIKEND